MKRTATKGKTLFSAQVTTAIENCDVIQERLEVLGLALVETQDVDAGQARYDDYVATRALAVARLEALKPLFKAWLGGRHFTARVATLANRDWSEAWKASFHTARVSRRIVIKPSWETYQPQTGDCVIEMDPGMSFGTGLHPTTRACLRFIDRLAKRSECTSFFDAGCGSGVLAMAAAMLGFERVVAVDFDPVAVEASKKNCRRNGLGRRVRCLQGDLLSYKDGKSYSVVAANMFSTEHERFQKTIADAVSIDPPGYLLIAGTLQHQYPHVRAMYERRGFTEVTSVKAKEWRSGVMVRVRA